MYHLKCDCYTLEYYSIIFRIQFLPVFWANLDMSAMERGLSKVKKWEL